MIIPYIKFTENVVLAMSISMLLFSSLILRKMWYKACWTIHEWIFFYNCRCCCMVQYLVVCLLFSLLLHFWVTSLHLYILRMRSSICAFIKFSQALLHITF